MRPVKTHEGPEQTLEGRLLIIRQVLGQGTELYLGQVADRAGIPRSTLKNAIARNSLSYELAQKLAHLFLDSEAATILWLREGTGDAPRTPKKAPISLMGPRSNAERPGTPLAAEQRMRAERAGLALQRSVEEGELYAGNAGGWVLHDVLIDLATLLAKHGAPNGDVLTYAEQLRGELKPRSTSR